MFDKRLMKMCPESRKYIIGNVIFQFLELFFNVAVIVTIAYAVQRIYLKEWTSRDLIVPIIIIAAAVALRFFMTRLATRMSYLASRTVKKVMRGQIYEKLLRLGTSYRDHVTTAELVQESVEGVEQLESYFGQYVPQFFYAFIAPVCLFLLFGFGGSWLVAAVLLICVPLIPGAIMMVQKIAKRILSKYWGQYTQLGSTFLENLQGMTTLKTYQADGFKNEQMNEESEKFRQVTMKVLTMQLNSVTIMDAVAYGGAALGILLATAAFIRGDIALFNCVFMILLSAEFFLPMRRLGSYFHVAMNGMAASDKIFNFLNTEEPTGQDESIDGLRCDIELSDLSFSYDGSRQVLKDISMTFPEKGFTCITGESGSGKSTIASLIMGRHGDFEGELKVGGIDIRKVDRSSLMRNITYVGIGSVFFKGTVRDNLRLAMPDADDETMYAALERCRVADFFKSVDGLDTQLLENASNLSGGQRQRLALARAELLGARVYIFDEATSNIDVESEEDIMKRIREIAREKTVIMISHRLANVREADMIYCLEDGMIAECGTHDELLEREGVYARLWKTQQELEMYGKEAAR